MNILSLLIPKASTIFVLDTSSVRQVLEKIEVHKYSVVPIIDENGKYVSSASEGDILRFIRNEEEFNLDKLEHICITELERYRPYVAMDISASFEELYEISLKQNFVPIIDDRGIFIGIVTRKNIIEALFKVE